MWYQIQKGLKIKKIIPTYNTVQVIYISIIIYYNVIIYVNKCPI